MKAFLVKELGSFQDASKMGVAETPDPAIRKGFVLVQVAAAGLNFADLLQVQVLRSMEGSTMIGLDQHAVLFDTMT